MRPPRLSIALLALTLGACTTSDVRTPSTPPNPWPEIARENKPWTRWWWPGSGVDKQSLTEQMERLAAAGIGGVEITPIYGAKGYEERYIDFLSPKWMEMLEHVGREGQRLGLGVDMATGTGWPFGGPWVTEADALKRASLQDGRITGVPTKMKVKRAAPGGEGLVVDPYSADGLRRYLAPIDKAFESLPRGLVRSQFHDSFEYFDASWTSVLPAVFKQMHGYDLQEHAAELLGQKPTDPDTLGRLKSDYREVLAKLHLDFLRTWIDWSHGRGFLVRNQSHGAPANLLDLYANVDIAETEVFGSTPFPIPGLRRNPEDVRHDQDLPEGLMIRMASSASHVAGHPLSSSETCTWLRDHWKVALAYTKPEIDRLFAEGINHIFYHGTVFSPRDAKWPGWLFYASTQFHPNNTWWADFGALNQYVTRVQSILQGGKPDNDIALYWPVADVWDNPKGLMTQLGVHHVSWLTEHPFGKTARALLDAGYSVDYISDAQLLQGRTEHRQLVTPGARYRVLVVPATRRMPVPTLERILEIARSGTPVCFMALPEDVPGLGRLEARRAAFKQLIQSLQELNRGQQRTLVVGGNPGAFLPDVGFLEQCGSTREAIAETGVSVIRRATDAGYDYFFANLTGKHLEGWIPIGTIAAAAAILDPLTGAAGAAALRGPANGPTEVFLQIGSGESLILRTQRSGPGLRLAAWPYRAHAGAALAVQPAPGTDGWKVEFIQGGPELPAPVTMPALASWTELESDEAKRFGGTARYRIEFDAPGAKADDWLLQLGELRESARVRLNGEPAGTVWSLPFEVRVGRWLRPGRNVLELEVTNLAANRIRDMDKRGVEWKIMREINFVNINYRPFNAANWPLTPSGLIGPVTLTPLQALQPR